MQLYKRTSMIVYSILIFRILFWFYRISLFFWRDYYALDLPQKLFFVVAFIVSIYIFEIWCILSSDEENKFCFFLSKSIWKTLGTQAWEVSQCSLYLLDILLLKKINVSSAFKQALLLCKTWGILFILIENNEASNIDPCDYRKNWYVCMVWFQPQLLHQKFTTFYFI